MDLDSRIISVALVRYADACSPKLLHSDCPFARDDGQGGRACQSECRDVITRLAKPGYAKVPAFAEVPFDARQLLLSESGPVPHADWHTASLLQRVRSAPLHSPRYRDGQYHLKRHIDITNGLAYLAQRGHEPEWIVREGFGIFLPLQLMLWICDNYASRTTKPDVLKHDPTGGWFEIFEDHVGSIDASFTTGQLLALAQRTGFDAYLHRWVMAAPLADLLDWKPVPVPDRDSTFELDGTALWVFERLTMTYLTDWNLPSLHHEYMYLNGAGAPVPLSEMLERVVPEADLTREIARRAVEDKDHAEFAMVTRQALLLLNDARAREAAALFDALRIIDPANSDAHNNYGFCLTLDDPAAALVALQESQRLEDAPVPLNRLNQAVALLLLGRPTEALPLVEEAHLTRRHFPGVAWLWRGIVDDEEREVGEVNPREYLCLLGLAVAQTADDEDAVHLWQERLADLG